MQRVTTKLNVRCDCRNLISSILSRAASSGRAGSTSRRSIPAVGSESQQDDEISSWPRKIFSGIQPTGSVHLGNYLGAVRRWVELQDTREDVTICIVDMHSITLPQNPPALRDNIFKMAATLLSCGLDPTQSTLFVQSAVMEHCEFNWLLNCMTTMARLGQLPQFKEKSKMVRDVPLGLYVYPVLQAADIMLYKATHVPVGADQLQHIQLAQHLARTFNTRYGQMFPVCHAMIDQEEASRIRSLRNPAQKMSKSDNDSKSTINVNDEPDAIVEKIKKAVTDFNSDVTFDFKTRPGVSNLLSIHSLVTGTPVADIVEEAKTLDTGMYKRRVAEAVIEHLRPIREQINQHMSRRNELVYMLEIGAEKARQQAQQTMNDVKQRMGLGTYLNTPMPVQMAEHLQERSSSSITASQRMHRSPKGGGGQRDGGGVGAGVGGASAGSMTYTGAGGDATQASDKAFDEGYDHQRRDMGKGMRTRTNEYRPMVPVQKKRVEKVPRKAPAEQFTLEDIPQPTKMPFNMSIPTISSSNPYQTIANNNPYPTISTGNSYQKKTQLNSIQGGIKVVNYAMQSTGAKVNISGGKPVSSSKASAMTPKSASNSSVSSGNSGSSASSSSSNSSNSSSSSAQSATNASSSSAASTGASSSYQSQVSTYQDISEENESSSSGSTEDDDDNDSKLKKVEI